MGRFGEKHVDVGEQPPFDRTPADILLTLFELYPEAAMAWTDCYAEADAIKGIRTRAELLNELLDMAQLASIITPAEYTVMRRTFGLAA